MIEQEPAEEGRRGGLKLQGARNAEELDSIVSQLRDCVDDIVGRDRDVLAPRPLIELEILVDL